MSWLYSGDPASSPKDTVRFLIGDTNPRDQLLQDEEINWLLTRYHNSYLNAAIRACETIVSKFSRMADETVGSIKISYSQKAAGYRALRSDLLRRLALEDSGVYAGGISSIDVERVKANPDRVAPAFTKHQMDNNNEDN